MLISFSMHVDSLVQIHRHSEPLEAKISQFSSNSVYFVESNSSANSVGGGEESLSKELLNFQKKCFECRRLALVLITQLNGKTFSKWSLYGFLLLFCQIVLVLNYLIFSHFFFIKFSLTLAPGPLPSHKLRSILSWRSTISCLVDYVQFYICIHLLVC
jgi:hypothetical protein